MRVALFVPCFVDQLFPQVGLDTAAVLGRAGCEVVFPEDQTCCGQPAFNSGHWNAARPCAERFLRVFGGYEYVVSPSGSCATMVKKFYPELLESEMRGEALALGKRVHEFSEFLVRVAGVDKLGAEFPHKVAYHSSCHATRELGITEEPRILLRNVRGLELVEMGHADECCGFGGMFAVKFAAISSAMGDVKAANIEASGAEYVTATDSSCLMHVKGILRHTKRRAKTIHLASILAAGHK